MKLRQKPLDAIVMLGTGMPTLAPIVDASKRGGPPVISCMLCLAWRTIQNIEDRHPDLQTLMKWIEADDWFDRLAASRPYTQR